MCGARSLTKGAGASTQGRWGFIVHEMTMADGALRVNDAAGDEGGYCCTAGKARAAGGSGRGECLRRSVARRGTGTRCGQRREPDHAADATVRTLVRVDLGDAQ